MKELIKIQSELNAPKNQYNSFGKYKYRNAEGIIEALKPMLKEGSCYLLCNSEIVNNSDRFYVRVTATLYNSEGKSVSASAYAREQNEKKGMDAAQVTGACESYAKKYALGNLFAIDDSTYDPDSKDNSDQKPETLTDATRVKIEKLLNDERIPKSQRDKGFAWLEGDQTEEKGKILLAKLQKQLKS